MTPRERVMTALNRGQPDQVPWVENEVEEQLQIRSWAGAPTTPRASCAARWAWTASATTSHRRQGHRRPGAADRGTAAAKEAFYFPKKITFDFVPPWIADMGVDGSGRTFVKHGLLTDRDSLKLFDEFLPDPDHPARYEQIAEWIEQYREDYAVFARIRLGTASTIESMGLDVFSLMMFDDPDLVKEIHRRFSEWTVRVVENLNKLDFDFIWANDDHADTKMPWVNMEMYEEFLKPYQKLVAERDQEALGLPQRRQHVPDTRRAGEARHERDPPDPAGGDGHRQDEGGVRRQGVPHRQHRPRLHAHPRHARGDRSEVKERIEKAGKGGGYMISSANSLTDYCKIENVWAMASAMKKYGKY